jgi:hypothetical protein
MEQQREQLGDDARSPAAQARQVGPVHLEHIALARGGVDAMARHLVMLRHDLAAAHRRRLGEQVVGEANSVVD